MKFQTAKSLGLVALFVAAANFAQADIILFQDRFEGTNLNQWIGKAGGPHQGQLIVDPLDPANQVLGFTGINFRQPEMLRRTMLTIAPRIRQMVEADQTARICPESYEGIDTRNLVQPPSSRMAIVGIIFLCFILAIVVSYFVMYRSASKELSASLTQILAQDMSAPKK